MITSIPTIKMFGIETTKTIAIKIRQRHYFINRCTSCDIWPKRLSASPAIPLSSYLIRYRRNVLSHTPRSIAASSCVSRPSFHPHSSLQTSSSVPPATPPNVSWIAPCYPYNIRTVYVLQIRTVYLFATLAIRILDTVAQVLYN